MSKKKNQPIIDVTGMSIEDIMGLTAEEVNTMSKKNLSKVTSRLASAANKRIKRMKQANVSSPALAGVEASGGKLSVKGKNQGQLKSEFTRAKQFLQGKTSGLQKAKSYKAKLAKNLGVKQISDQQIGEIERIMEKIKQMDPNLTRVGNRYSTNDDNVDYTNIKKMVAKGLDEGLSPEDILEKATERLEELNEERINRESEYFSDFFETEDDIPF